MEGYFQSKKLGGLGFRRFKDFNFALLAKLGWNLSSGVNSLLTDILKAKYLKGKSFLEVWKTNGFSMVWQGIHSTRPLLRKEVCYKIGNGMKINPWMDLGVASLLNCSPTLRERLMRDIGVRCLI